MARVSRGIQQKDVAEKLGVTVQYVSAVENGRKKMSIDKLIQMAKALDCSLDELTGFFIRKED